MQVQVAETGPCSRTVTITVPPARIKQEVDQIYATAHQQQVRIPGFRPGHVPRQMLEKKFGQGILQEAKEQIVNRCVSDALRDQKLAVIGRVHVEDFEKLEVKPDQAMELKVKFDVRPTFELKNPKGIEVGAFDPAVTDEDLQAALNEIAGTKRAIKPVQDGAQDGDFVKVDLRFLDEGGGQVHERKGVQINTRIPVAGTDPQAFQQALQGVTAGQSLELPLTFPDKFEKEAVRGKQGKVVMQVHEVLRVTAPPIDDALAKTLDFPDLATLQEDLRKRIGEEKLRVGKLRQEDQVFEVLLNDHPFELPASLVQEQTEANLRQFGARLKEQGTAEDEVNKKLEEARGEAENDAVRRVRLFFLVEAIARKEKLFVTETDVDAEVKKIAEQNKVTPGQVLQYLEQNKQLSDLRLALMERKVRDFLRDNARIVDRKGA
jgi:trigger factor